MGNTRVPLFLYQRIFKIMRTTNLRKLYAYYQAMKFKKMITTGEYLLKSHQTDQQLLNILGLAYDQYAINLPASIKKENYQKKAISHFKTLLKINSKSPQAFRGLGLVALHQNKLTRSLTYYKKAYALNKKDVSNFSSLGNVYRRMRNYTEALMWYKKCLSIKALRATTYINIASLYEDQNKLISAKHYARLALKHFKKQDNGYTDMMKKKAQQILGDFPF